MTRTLKNRHPNSRPRPLVNTYTVCRKMASAPGGPPAATPLPDSDTEDDTRLDEDPFASIPIQLPQQTSDKSTAPAAKVVNRSRLFNDAQIQLMEANLATLTYTRIQSDMEANAPFLKKLNAIRNPADPPINLMQLAYKLRSYHIMATENAQSSGGTLDNESEEQMVTRLKKKRASPAQDADTASPAPQNKRQATVSSVRTKSIKEKTHKAIVANIRSSASDAKLAALNKKVDMLTNIIESQKTEVGALRHNLGFAESAYETVRIENQRLTTLNDRLYNELADCRKQEAISSRQLSEFTRVCEQRDQLKEEIAMRDRAAKRERDHRKARDHFVAEVTAGLAGLEDNPIVFDEN